jgi:hypothetical protein
VLEGQRADVGWLVDRGLDLWRRALLQVLLDPAVLVGKSIFFGGGPEDPGPKLLGRWYDPRVAAEDGVDS